MNQPRANETLNQLTSKIKTLEAKRDQLIHDVHNEYEAKMAKLHAKKQTLESKQLKKEKKAAKIKRKAAKATFLSSSPKFQANLSQLGALLS